MLLVARRVITFLEKHRTLSCIGQGLNLTHFTELVKSFFEGLEYFEIELA